MYKLANKWTENQEAESPRATEQKKGGDHETAGAFRRDCSAISLLTVFCSAWQLDSRDAHALKVGGVPYFTTKMGNLTTKLDLTPDQQTKLKPVAEQEVGLLEEIRGNSLLSRKEKIAQLEKIVLDSDKRMKPWLSDQQWQKLQALRKEQKEQLKQYVNTK